MISRSAPRGSWIIIDVYCYRNKINRFKTSSNFLDNDYYNQNLSKLMEIIFPNKILNSFLLDHNSATLFTKQFKLVLNDNVYFVKKLTDYKHKLPKDYKIYQCFCNKEVILISNFEILLKNMELFQMKPYNWFEQSANYVE